MPRSAPGGFQSFKRNALEPFLLSNGYDVSPMLGRNAIVLPVVCSSARRAEPFGYSSPSAQRLDDTVCVQHACMLAGFLTMSTRFSR